MKMASWKRKGLIKLENTGSSVGNVFAQRCQKPFSELSATSSDKRRKNDVFDLRGGSSQPFLSRIVPLATRKVEDMESLAADVTFGPKPEQQPAKKYGRQTTRRLNQRSRARWRRQLHPAGIKGRVKAARPRFKTVNGLNAAMRSLEDEGVRDATKSWLGGTPWSDIYVLGIDKGEVNTVAAFASSPTSAAGYSGRAESTLFYSSAELLRSRDESVRQAHRFRNRIAEELCPDIGEKTTDNTTLNDALDALHALNSTNEWRRLRQEVERKAALSRAAGQILDGVLGTYAANESKSLEELGVRKLLVFVGDGGGGVRKGSRGPNPANRLVRELEVEAEARGIDAKFVIVPETMTSKRCSKPYCRDADGRRSK